MCTTIAKSISVKLRVVFVPEKIPYYQACGVEIKNGAAVFNGTFHCVEDSKPCFNLAASVEAEAFGASRAASIPLNWDKADILSVGPAFQRDVYFWKAEWGEEEFLKMHNNN